MHHTRIVSAGLAALLILAALTGVAFAAQPDNYCSTVSVEATDNGAYNVTATGSGRYARIRDLTAAQTVVATDFGAGATVYTWTGLVLDTSHNYQVQVSHTSLTTGYSTSGCLFTPPPPQAVIVDRFEWIDGAFEWDVTEEGLGYWIIGPYYASAYVPAQAPGTWGYFSYRLAPVQRVRDGTYYLWSQDLSGATGIAAVLVKGGKPGTD